MDAGVQLAEGAAGEKVTASFLTTKQMMARQAEAEAAKQAAADGPLRRQLWSPLNSPCYIILSPSYLAAKICDRICSLEAFDPDLMIDIFLAY